MELEAGDQGLQAWRGQSCPAHPGPILGVTTASTSAVGGCPSPAEAPQQGEGMGMESALLNGAGACGARDLCGAFPEALPTEKCHGTSWACSPGRHSLCESTEGAELPPSASARLPGCGVRTKGEVRPTPWCTPAALPAPLPFFPILCSV